MRRLSATLIRGKLEIRRSSWLQAWDRGSPARPFTWIAAITSWDFEVFCPERSEGSLSSLCSEGSIHVTGCSLCDIHCDRFANRGWSGLVCLSEGSHRQILHSCCDLVCAEWSVAGGNDIKNYTTTEALAFKRM